MAIFGVAAAAALTLGPQRADLVVHVAADADPASVTRAVDEAILIEEARRATPVQDPVLEGRVAEVHGVLQGDALTRDPLVRARLVDHGARALRRAASPPTDAQVRAYAAERLDRYASAATVDFLQSGLHKSNAMLPRSMTRASLARVAGTFGPRFAAALEGCEVGVWCGPLESSYGAHRVQVLARHPPALDAYGLARARRDLTTERKAKAVRAGIDRARRRYAIQIRRAP